jgi:hypothetical protein
LTTEVELLRLILLSLSIGSPNQHTSWGIAEPLILGALATIAPGAHMIDITPARASSNRDRQLENIRAYYSRWLARVSFLLRAHSDAKIVIDTYFLDNLLNALHVTACYNALNPPDSVSTHHPQSNTPKQQKYSFVIPVVGGPSLSVGAHDLGSGPLGGLIGILRNHSDAKEGSLIKTRLAALDTVSALAPVLLQQLLGLSRDKLVAEFNFHTWPDVDLDDQNGVRYAATRLALVLLRYLGPHLFRTTEYTDICAQAMHLIYDYVGENNIDYEGGRAALLHHGNDFVPILECTAASNENLTKLTGTMMFHFIELSRFNITDEPVKLCDAIFPPSCFLPLITMIGHTEHDTEDTGEMLGSMVKRMRKDVSGAAQQNEPYISQVPSIEYLRTFMHTDQGFSAVNHAASLEKYRGVMVPMIAEIVHLAAGRDPALVVDPAGIHPCAVPGFLDLVSTMAKHYSGSWYYSDNLFAFAPDALDLLAVASNDDESKKLILKHPLHDDLYKALTSLEDSDPAQELTERLRKWQKEIGVEIKG